MASTPITILLPYGIFEKSNLQYKKYLDQAFEIINKSTDQKLVFCGGLTNNKTSLSEAKSLKNYFLEQNSNFNEDNIFLEEKSLTTPQNLKFALEILKEKEIVPSFIQIICDSIRVPKVYYFALTYFSALLGQDISEEQIYHTLLAKFVEHKLDLTKQIKVEYEKISIVGLSLTRTEKELGQQILATMEEIGGAKYPSLEEKILAIRKKEWQLTQK